MTTPLAQSEKPSLSTPGLRAQSVWLIAAQCIAVALTALALWWTPAPKKATAELLTLLAGSQLLIASVAVWRRSEMASVLGGMSLAIACWLSVEKTWTLPAQWPLAQIQADIPLALPLVLGIALVLAIWGALTRSGLKDRSRFGVCAVIGGAALALLAVLFFVVINYLPMFKTLYLIEPYQLAALLVSVLLYVPAIWLGTVGVRASGGWPIQPIGMALVLSAFTVYWNR